MLEQMFNGLMLALDPLSILVVAIGVVVGILIGSIPGLTTTMGMAIFVPFTFFLPPLVGLPFLIGLYKGGIYGGSIPAILINAPGTGAAIATVFDGYELAKQGRAGSALKVALFSSTIGDTLSDIITILLAQSVVSIALLVGKPELFSILVCSLAIIATMTGGSVVKGLMAAALGLMLATVGTDIGGRWRFAFGNTDLAGGFSLITLLIGLFAFATIIERVLEGKKADEKQREIFKISKEDKLHWWEFRKCIPHILRSTGIGAFIGLVPAVGQPVAAFLGYSCAKRFSKEPEKFGKGSLEGVAGPEACNNAVNGPTLLPLMAFGIPGDMVTAVLLGALIVQGLRPGPGLFRNYGDIMYGILMSMMVANAFMFVFGYIFSGLYAKIARINSKYLIPAVFALAIVGSYAVNNNVFDVAIMVFFGFVGFLLNRFDIPLAPLVITFLLGHGVENSLIQSLILFKGDPLGFIYRPFCLALLVFSVLLICVPGIISWYKKYKVLKTGSS
ncbi:MAG: tripartite tricarboxylate transporter permease [Desulfobacterales bacterium]|nr:tripartite tricarboxylate transporter permease [Desulfobacterales bacterium]